MRQESSQARFIKRTAREYRACEHTPYHASYNPLARDHERDPKRLLPGTHEYTVSHAGELIAQMERDHTGY